MKKILIFLILTSLMGCESQSQKNRSDSKVSMVDQISQYPFEIKRTVSIVNSGGFIEVQVEGVSHISDYTTLEYRVNWLDSQGISIYSSRNNQWTEFPVFRKQNFSFVAVAPNPKVQNFKMYIRDQKNNSYSVYDSNQGEKNEIY